MKRLFLSCIAVIAAFTTINAQSDNKFFNHMGAGIEVGTTGIGVEVAAPLTGFLDVRAGVDIVPSITVKDIKVKVNANDTEWNQTRERIQNMKDKYYSFLPADQKQLVDDFTPYLNTEIPSKVLLDGKLSMTNFKLLFDIFPSKKSSFHFTAGFYAGKSQIIDAYTTNCQSQLEALTSYNQNFAGKQLHATGEVGGKTLSYDYTFPDKIGVKMGDYLLEPNGKEVRGHIKVSGFKPYLGIGFGRAVPQNHRFAFNFDLGAMFWGTPKIYVEQPSGQVQIEKGSVDGDGGFVKTVSKISVYPCMTFRLTGRIF